MVFKQSIAADEIFESMTDQLENGPIDEVVTDKIASALKSLDSAASLFEDIGLDKEAEIITRLIEKIASQG